MESHFDRAQKLFPKRKLAGASEAQYYQQYDREPAPREDNDPSFTNWLVYSAPFGYSPRKWIRYRFADAMPSHPLLTSLKDGISEVPTDIVKRMFGIIKDELGRR